MFVLTEGALTVTPGPAVLLVVSQGLRRGSAGALWSAVGILHPGFVRSNPPPKQVPAGEKALTNRRSKDWTALGSLAFDAYL